MLRSTLPAGGGSWVLTAGPGTPLQRTGGLWAELATGLGLGICCFFPPQDLLGLGGCFFYLPLGHPSGSPAAFPRRPLRGAGNRGCVRGRVPPSHPQQLRRPPPSPPRPPAVGAGRRGRAGAGRRGGRSRQGRREGGGAGGSGSGSAAQCGAERSRAQRRGSGRQPPARSPPARPGGAARSGAERAPSTPGILQALRGVSAGPEELGPGRCLSPMEFT